MGHSGPISLVSKFQFTNSCFLLTCLDGKSYVYAINDFWVIGSQQTADILRIVSEIPNLLQGHVGDVDQVDAMSSFSFLFHLRLRQF